MKHWTLRRKIVSFAIAIMAVFLVTRAMGEAIQSYDVYLHFVVDEARSIAETLAVAIAQGDYWDDPDRMQSLLSALQDQAGQDTRQVLVVDSSSQVLAATDPAMIGSKLSDDAQRKLSEVIDHGMVETLGVPGASGMTTQVAVPIEVYGQRKGALLVQYLQDPAWALAGAKAKSEVFTFTVMTMGLVLALLVGLRKMVLQPLATLKEGAARFGEGDLDARIELKTGDELETVARAFNRMAVALKAYHAERVAQEKQATLVDVACVTACELSQPLTVVLGYAELLREQEIPSPEFLNEAIQSIQRCSHMMAGIVRQLSTMSDSYGASVQLRSDAPAMVSSLGMNPQA